MASLLQPPPLMCARVLFSFLLWEVLEIEKWNKRGKRRTKQILFNNDFQNEATLVKENEKANTWRACHSRHRWCARVLFSFLLCEMLENEKRNKQKKKAHQTNTFQERFSERGHSRKGKWKSKHVASLLQPPPLICACSFFHFFGGKCSKMKNEKNGKIRRTKLFFSETIFRTRPLS